MLAETGGDHPVVRAARRWAYRRSAAFDAATERDFTTRELRAGLEHAGFRDVRLCRREYLGYLLMAWAIPADERPAWITEARSLPLVVAGADWLQSVMPDRAAEEGVVAADAAKRQIERAAKAEEVLSDFMAPVPALGQGGTARNPDVPEEGSGYKDDERNQMDRLFQGAQ